MRRWTASLFESGFRTMLCTMRALGAGSSSTPLAGFHLEQHASNLQHPLCLKQHHMGSQQLRNVAANTSSSKDGVRFVYDHPGRTLKLKFGRTSSSTVQTPTDVMPEVDVMIEGYNGLPRDELDALSEQVREEAGCVMRQALLNKAEAEPSYKLPRMASLSVVLCGDMHIRALNLQHRNKDAPTDVLSFEMQDEMDYKVHLPMKLLGDVIISMDTASRQARERRYTLLDEIRVLLVHGVLHLCGFDHERGPQQHIEMQEQEQRMMQAMGWEGAGLITAQDEVEEPEQVPVAAGQRAQQGKGGRADAAGGMPGLGSIWQASMASDGASGGGRSNVVRRAAFASQEKLREKAAVTAPTPAAVKAGRPRRSSDVRLVALDMDGTLLDSKCNILPSSIQVIKAARRAGVQVILATGKARPAAITAAKKFGLEGDALLVSPRTPGLFLQGLAVHGAGGTQLSDAQLPASVVASVFRFVESHAGISVCAFLGDDCATLCLTDDLISLNAKYYEPLSKELPSLKALLAGPPVKKLLLMADPSIVEELLTPYWEAALTAGSGASVMQAVPNMLEIVPEGINKWVGAQLLLKNLGIPRESFMACGDGGNDFEMVSNAGIGIAMGNAVTKVKRGATFVVSSHDHDGIAEAFEKYVL